MRIGMLLLILSFALTGCDGMVGFEGWVVKADRQGGVGVLRQRPVGVPKDALDSVWVELWTGDGKHLLDRNESKIGYFSVTYIGPYQPMMEYILKVGAPGFGTIERKLRLNRTRVTWGRIDLVPLGDGRDSHLLLPTPTGRPATSPSMSG